MAIRPSTWNHLAVLTELVESSPVIGRTAIMKLSFFLVALRNVPLDYDFRLYTYGPFDKDVLDDLNYAVALGAVTSEVVPNLRGYGYDLRGGSKAAEVKAKARDFLAKHEGDIRWVLDKFGSYSSSELELLSTIVYVNREAALSNEKLSLEELVTQVHEVKPHFDKSYIQKQAEFLQSQGLLGAIG